MKTTKLFKDQVVSKTNLKNLATVISANQFNTSKKGLALLWLYFIIRQMRADSKIKSVKKTDILNYLLQVDSDRSKKFLTYQPKSELTVYDTVNKDNRSTIVKTIVDLRKQVQQVQQKQAVLVTA